MTATSAQLWVAVMSTGAAEAITGAPWKSSASVLPGTPVTAAAITASKIVGCSTSLLPVKPESERASPSTADDDGVAGAAQPLAVAHDAADLVGAERDGDDPDHLVGGVDHRRRDEGHGSAARRRIGGEIGERQVGVGGAGHRLAEHHAEARLGVGSALGEIGGEIVGLERRIDEIALRIEQVEVAIALRRDLLAIDRLVMQVVDRIGGGDALDLVDIDAARRLARQVGATQHLAGVAAEFGIVHAAPGFGKILDGEQRVVGARGLDEVGLDALQVDAELVGAFEGDGVEVLPRLGFERLRGKKEGGEADSSRDDDGRAYQGQRQFARNPHLKSPPGPLHPKGQNSSGNVR